MRRPASFVELLTKYYCWLLRKWKQGHRFEQERDRSSLDSKSIIRYIRLLWIYLTFHIFKKHYLKYFNSIKWFGNFPSHGIREKHLNLFKKKMYAPGKIGKMVQVDGHRLLRIWIEIALLDDEMILDEVG